MQPKTVIIFCFAFFVLTGCVPKTDKAVAIRESDVQAELGKNGFDDETLVREWWRGYGDEQLDTLVETALAKASRL